MSLNFFSKVAVMISLCMLLCGCSEDRKNRHVVSEDEVGAVEYQIEHITSPDEALESLLAGNKRYMKDSCLIPHHNHQRIEHTAPHQTPFAAVVGCSDSRVPIELVFDQGIGDVFVIRTAGNSVNDDVVMGSVEYAVDHLGVKLVMVLGHESCGGVTGAISEAHGQKHSLRVSKVDKLLRIIRKDVKKFVGKPEQVDEAIRQNALVQVKRILGNKQINSLVEEGKLLVKAAYYNVHSGLVEVIE